MNKFLINHNTFASSKIYFSPMKEREAIIRRIRKVGISITAGDMKHIRRLFHMENFDVELVIVHDGFVSGRVKSNYGGGVVILVKCLLDDSLHVVTYGDYLDGETIVAPSGECVFGEMNGRYFGYVERVSDSDNRYTFSFDSIVLSNERMKAHTMAGVVGNVSFAASAALMREATKRAREEGKINTVKKEKPSLRLVS